MRYLAVTIILLALMLYAGTPARADDPTATPTPTLLPTSTARPFPTSALGALPLVTKTRIPVATHGAGLDLSIASDTGDLYSEMVNHYDALTRAMGKWQTYANLGLYIIVVIGSLIGVYSMLRKRGLIASASLDAKVYSLRNPMQFTRRVRRTIRKA